MLAPDPTKLRSCMDLARKLACIRQWHVRSPGKRTSCCDTKDRDRSHSAAPEQQLSRWRTDRSDPQTAALDMLGLRTRCNPPHTRSRQRMRATLVKGSVVKFAP